ncbi:MAG: M1 family aminopeptidase [Nitrospirota bacterium]
MNRRVVIGLAVALAACQGSAFRSNVSLEFLSLTPVQPRHHRLKVSIDPATHTLTTEDQVKLQMKLQPNGARPPSLAFYLAPQLRVESVLIDEQPAPVRRKPPRLPSGPLNGRRYARFEELARYEIALPPDAHDSPTLTVRAAGPWPADAQGMQLAGHSGWHPLWPNALFTFDLEVEHPQAWESVSAGVLTRREPSGQRAHSTWSMAQPTDAIDLFAGPYVVTTRSVGALPVSTYFFQDEVSLAPEYLEAAADYLARYSRLLGPYPFQTFAIVETPAPIGAAVPSLALLGQSLVRRHYTQPYGLGHEIVHAWLGNHVMVDEAEGNWAEALTTYLANYYTVEETDGEEAARRQRRQMLIQYATWTTPQTDYPLMRFLDNMSQTDAAVGYQKGAMVFHLLRRMLGEEEFFGALRELTERYGGKRAGWNDLRLLFEARLGRPLDWFFRQWIVQPGAPQLAIERVELTPAPADHEAPEGTRIAVHLRQAPPLFRLPVTIHIETPDRILEKSFWMDQAEAVIETIAAQPPIRITVDPDEQLFRRLAREELPPMLNLTLTEPALRIVPPGLADHAESELYATIARQAAERAAGRVEDDGGLLLLGGPAQNRETAEAAERLPSSIRLGLLDFTIDGRTYHDASHALLLTFRDPARQHRPTTIFYGLSADAVRPLIPLLLYHGWDSYLVFDNGRAIVKGALPAAREPLIWTSRPDEAAP